MDRVEAIILVSSVLLRLSQLDDVSAFLAPEKQRWWAASVARLQLEAEDAITTLDAGASPAERIRALHHLKTGMGL